MSAGAHPFLPLIQAAGLTAASDLPVNDHAAAASATLGDLRDMLSALSLVLMIVKPPSSASSSLEVTVDAVLSDSPLVSWVTRLITASSADAVAATLHAHALTVPSLALILAGSAGQAVTVAASSGIRMVTPETVSLIPLPSQFDLLFGKLCSTTCSNCGKQPENPVLCLACGSFLCGGGYTGVR